MTGTSEAKFIFWVYYPEEKESWMYEKLDKNIIIISTDEFSNINLHDKKYTHNNDPHPSENVWKELTHPLINYINNKNIISL